MRRLPDLHEPLEIKLPRPDPMMTVDEAQEYITDRSVEGTLCPCCGQRVQVYPRKFNANMATFLVSLVMRSKERGWDWVHYSDCQFTGRDYPYVKVWGLAVTASSDDARKRTSGLWKPTDRGVRFVNGDLRLHEYAMIYDNALCGYSKGTIHIWDALGSRFAYDEMMGQWR